MRSSSLLADTIARASVYVSTIALVLASASLGGCCNQTDGTRCIDWDQSMTCPAPDATLVKAFDADTVNSPGTFWPAHEYLISGVRTTTPAACCYEITYTVCSKDLR
jgi:hypothetical protein